MIFAELLENSLKNCAIFQGFAVLPYVIKDFREYLIDIGYFNTKQHLTIIGHYV